MFTGIEVRWHHDRLPELILKVGDDVELIEAMNATPWAVYENGDHFTCVRYTAGLANIGHYSKHQKPGFAVIDPVVLDQHRFVFHKFASHVLDVNGIRFWRVGVYIRGIQFIMYVPLHTLIGPVAALLRQNGLYLFVDSETQEWIISSSETEIVVPKGYDRLVNLISTEATCVGA